MENKKTLHIIPHSHWDREWYMGFDRHRVHLVELFDALITTMENHPEYTYYHFDGQFAPIEDYLEIKPEMKDRLYRLIREDRIQVGPWYILQDEYLTSGESNVRNMLYGLRLCREIGAEPVRCGYFPDAFGNVSQAPQILRGFGMDAAVFGRGLNDLGSNNAVVKQNGITSSELKWRSPDGSEVIGVMFANWYHNAMELPTDKEALRCRIHDIVASTSRFAVTDQLLGMNGCDHQPVQTNLHEVIKLANEVQDEVTVKQSNFKDYLDLIRQNEDRLPPFTGEINGQYTEGFFLLINTASCRVDIKQQNRIGSLLLERIAEPLNVFSMLGGDEYRADFFRYSWKKLMQNHPHDSICSCSADDVYDEMMTRFMKSRLTADEMRKASLDYLAANTDTSALNETNVIVATLDPHSTVQTVKVNVDFAEDDPVEGISFLDENGCDVPAKVTCLGRTFTYTLPKDRFRQPRYVKRFEAELLVKGEGMATRTFRVVKEAKKVATSLKYDREALTAENGFIRIRMNGDGTFTLTDLRSHRVFENCGYIEDTKDEGNTYLYGPVEGDTPILTLGKKAKVELYEECDFRVTFRAELNTEGMGANIVTYVSLTDGIKRADIRTEIKNDRGNHRLRAMFPAEIPASTDLAEGQFDLVRRTVYPWEHWKNPYNTQRCMAFFALESEDENKKGNLLVGGRGLCEYEIMRDGKNTMALTLVRCVGEIGDWGIFPTPKAQCIGNYTLEYTCVPYDNETKGAAYHEGYTFYDCAIDAIMTGKHGGSIPANEEFLGIDTPFVRLSAFKREEDGENVVVRLFNIADEAVNATLTVPACFREVYLCSMDEKRGEKLALSDGKLVLPFGKKKILSLMLVR